MTGLKRGNKSKHSENEAQKKQLDAAQRKIDQLKFLLEQRDQVIKVSRGLLILMSLQFYNSLEQFQIKK